MIKLAICQRIKAVGQVAEERDCLDQRVVDLVVSLGMLPMPVPNLAVANVQELGLLDGWLNAIKPDGIILTGGDDPRKRDRRWWTERNLISFARCHRLPMLGICRGMQRLALEDGGVVGVVQGHIGTRHTISTRAALVNSYHELAVVSLPADWTPTSYASDGVLESMRHSEMPWHGCMWHPEREAPVTQEDRNWISRLFTGRDVT